MIGRIPTVVFLSLLAFPIAAQAAAAPAEICDILVSQNGGPEQEVSLPNYSVIEKTADPNFTIVPGPGATLLAFVCDRDDIVPAANDWKILAAGYKLHVRARHLEGVLEMSDGRVRYRLTDHHDHMDGEATARLGPRLDAFQQAIQSAPPPAPAPAAPAAPDAQPAPPTPGQ